MPLNYPTSEAYERHLPHQIPEGFPLFITCNLKGAIPQEVRERFLREREQLEREPLRPAETPHARRTRHSKIIFAMTDGYLDGQKTGPLHLRESNAAKLVADAILFGVPERYKLFAYCVMPNHIHLLLTPVWKYRKLMQGVKGYTAYQVNQLQQQRDRVFWQDESYDHWPRDEAEFFRIIAYIENNPVAAGLCARPEDWPWSSASKRSIWPLGEPLSAEMALMLRIPL